MKNKTLKTKILKKHTPKPLELSKERIIAFKKISKTPQRGLGDKVESIAQPIAKIIDKIAGTNIQGCGACKKRKEYLNKKFPKI